MKLNSFDKVKQLTEEMVAIPSINKEPGGESAVARYMQDFYMSLPYFQAHPEQVKCFQTKNDFVVRHSTLAYVKGTKGNSNRTVILIGHIDTVGVDDFGTIREYAFRCEELPAKLRETFVLPQEVIDDIESGEYLFGRGALDMKSGVAGHMYLIQYFSEHPEELDGNLLAIGECDEEDNSKGIITALDLLEELKEKEHFEYVACINADYSTNYAPGDENRYIYYGSIGKLLPCFAVFGKEAEAHKGPSIVICYAPCINHGIKRGMSGVQQEMKDAVASGYWNLYRYSPETKTFTLDSKEPTMPLYDFMKGEVRYASLELSFPDNAKVLFAEAEEAAQEKYESYRRKAEK